MRSLLFKAWLESRVRFLVGGLLLAAVTIALTRFFTRDLIRLGAGGDEWHRPISFMVFAGPPSMMFVMLALILGLGGLQRERATGTAVFTLALPVSRTQLTAARALVGLFEVVALSVIPAAVVLVWSRFIPAVPYPTMPALRTAGLWMTCGAVWFSLAFLWSVVISAEMTSTVVSMMTPLVWYTTARYTGLKRFPSLDVYGVMVGRTTEWSMPYHDFFTGQMIGPMPWGTIAAFFAVAGGLFALAVRLTRQQNY